MSLFKKSFGLARIYDQYYSNHQISNLIFKYWDRDLHDFPQCQANVTIYNEIYSGPYFEKARYFVNKYYKKKILKAICVIHIERDENFFSFYTVDREIIFFSKSFKQYLLNDVRYSKVKNQMLFENILKYLDLYIFSTQPLSKKDFN